MINLSSNYLGLPLVSPLIVSSCGLTGSVDKIRRFAEAGAGAVVLKSLFEEQIRFEAGVQIQRSDYPEAHDYISRYVKSNSLEEYLKLIESAKKTVKIPVIASINCISATEWISFAKNIEAAGADALELNVFFLASHKEVSGEKIENLYYEVLQKIREVASIPIAVKIGYQFTNLAATVNNMYLRGAKGVVLFNRFYEPDIDVEAMKLTSSEVLSSPADIRQSLRWVGILSDKVERIDIAASTGIHDGKAVIKQILAGAKAVQICSVLYKQGETQIKVMLDDLKSWMTRKKYNSIDDFRGKLNYSHIADPAMYERSQFMKYFSDFQ
jgi:dihydroorotate dehydrogenase (fumarate)